MSYMEYCCYPETLVIFISGGLHAVPPEARLSEMDFRIARDQYVLAGYKKRVTCQFV